MQYQTLDMQTPPYPHQSNNKVAAFAALALASCVALGVVASVTSPATSLYAPAAVQPIVSTASVPTMPRTVMQQRYEPAYAVSQGIEPIEYADAAPVQYTIPSHTQSSGLSSLFLFAAAAVTGAGAFFLGRATAPQPRWSMMMATASPELLEKVTDIVCEELGIDKADATPDANVQELGADSLDLVELIMRLEEEFDVEIPEEMAVKITTVQEAANAVAQQQG